MYHKAKEPPPIHIMVPNIKEIVDVPLSDEKRKTLPKNKRGLETTA